MAEEAPRPRRFIGRRAAEAAAAARGDGTEAAGGEVVPAKPATKRFVKQQVPDGILHDEALNAAIAVLPGNYNFEVHKTVARVRQLGAKRVALQFPEGLLMYACVIADILEMHGGVEHAFVMGDVTYGACCVDDFSAAALGADLLVHYGHSCLVPVDVTKVPCMYVFVDISVDVRHLVSTVAANFPSGANLVLAGTIQFASSIQAARQQLAADFPSLRVPQAKPLSPGEVLGCTAPVVPPETDAVVFVADGRFHLEAIMIANPATPAFRYDPYAREMTAESYDQEGMRAVRRAVVEAAAPARHWGVVLGTLGRQGNPRLVRHLQATLAGRGRSCLTVLLSEVTPAKLAQIGGIDAWVQVACPRLSIDWGEAFKTPTLTPYEALVALGEVPPWWEDASPPGAAAPPVASPQAGSEAGPPATAAQRQAPQLPRGIAAQQVPPHNGFRTGEGTPSRKAPAAAAAERGAAPAAPASDARPSPQGTGTAAAGPASGRLSTPSPAGPASASKGRPGQPEGRTSRARQPPLDALHQSPPGAPALERRPADASAGAAAARAAVGAAGPGSSPADTEPGGRSAQPAGRAVAEHVPADGDGRCAAPAAGIGASEQQRVADRSARQHIDAYPMDYYARDGGPWHSYYPPPAQQGAAGKLAALRAARAAQMAADVST